MSLICKIIGCRWGWVTNHKWTRWHRVEIYKHCLRCGKRNPNE